MNWIRHAVSLLVTAAIAILAPVASAKEARLDPEETIYAYFAALHAENHPKAYQLLSKEDQAAATLGEFTSFRTWPKEVAFFFRTVPLNIDITQTEPENGLLIFDVDEDRPDFGQINLELLESGGDLDRVLERWTATGVPVRKHHHRIKLIRQDDRWRVFLNIKRIKELMN